MTQRINESELAARSRKERAEFGALRINKSLVVARARRRCSLGTVAVAVAAGTLATSGVILATCTSEDSATSSERSEQEPGYFQCGAPVRWPMVGNSLRGVSLNIEKITRPSAAKLKSQINTPPVVTYTIGSVQNEALDPSEIAPSILVLRDGVVVGGPQPVDSSEQDNFVLPLMGEKLYGTARNPWPITEARPANHWLCDLTSWEEIWSDPGKYEIALVMTPLQQQLRGTGSSVAPRFDDLGNPLLISRMRLDKAE